MKSAKHSMRQNWKGGDPPHMRITIGDIDSFMKYEAPCVKGAIKVPTSTATTIKCFGHVHVNTWHNEIMEPNLAALTDPMLRPRLELLLRMVRESLCALPDRKGLDEMITILGGNDPNELAFRFTMHWLAAPLQDTGLNLQTNLWHIGELNGTGKGTLGLCMALIYTFANSALINQEDVSMGGWSDTLEGKLWVAINEIGLAGKFDWNSFIKQNSTEAVMQLRKRNFDPYSVLAFANWYITGNKETAPWGALDANDRRNAIIATTTDPEKALIAREFREYWSTNPEEAQIVLAGFVYLLLNIKVDHDLIARAPDTELKREMQEASSPEVDGTYWLINDDSIPATPGARPRIFCRTTRTSWRCPASRHGASALPYSASWRARAISSGSSGTRPRQPSSACPVADTRSGSQMRRWNQPNRPIYSPWCPQLAKSRQNT